MSTQLSIHCLGGLKVILSNRTIATFETEKAKALLVYLAVESRQELQRSYLAGLLWPDESEDRALHNLRQTLSSLRKTLAESPDNVNLILASREMIQLNPESRVFVDCTEFRKYFNAALAYYQDYDGRGLLHIRWIKQAMDLFQGEFLAHFSVSKSILFEEWACLQREELNLMAVRGHNLLSIYHENRGEYNLAIDYVAKIVKLCPWDESARNRMILLLGLDRQWSAAKLQFNALQRYLHDELSVAPSQDSIDRYDKICLAAEGKLTLVPEHSPTVFQLPQNDTLFVGREVELDELTSWLAEPGTRLITILGPGGIGKSRLAAEIGQQFSGLFQDGIFWIPLITAENADQIISLTAESIGLQFSDKLPNRMQLLEYLREKHLLLILDNFEHLLSDEKINQLLDSILTSAKKLKLLVTSREVLNLLQERVYLLAGLQYPNSNDRTIDDLRTYDAINLFFQRASQKLPNFSLTDQNAGNIIRICKLLEGLPLGVELAAAALCEQNCAQVPEAYIKDLNALTTRMSNFQQRHRSLNAAFELSWESLPAVLKERLFGLSFFLDGFSTQAAQAVAGASPRDLAALVTKCLLRLHENGHYSMHEAIRQFVNAKSLPGVSQPELKAAHAGYYAEFLLQQQPALLHDRQTEALNAIHLEIGNLSLCWNWLIEHCDDNRNTDLLKKSMDSLYQYFSTRGLEEGLTWFKRAAESCSLHGGSPLVLGMLLWRIGALAYAARDDQTILDSLKKSEALLQAQQALEELAYCRIYLGWAYQREKDFSRSQQYADLALEYFLAREEDLGLTHAYLLIGSIKNRQGQYQPSLVDFEKAYHHCKKTRNQRNLIITINRLADISSYEGDYARSVAFYQEALKYSEQLNDRYHQGMLLNNLGTIYHLKNEFSMAEQYYQRSLALTREIGDLDGTALALNNLGELATWQQEYEKALRYSEEALEIAQRLDETWTLIVCLNSLGEITRELHEHEKSKAYFEEALRLAVDIHGLDLVARVLVNLARVYQLTGDETFAVKVWKACLLHSATEQDSRDKAQHWLEEITTPTEGEQDDRWMSELISEDFHSLFSRPA